MRVKERLTPGKGWTRICDASEVNQPLVVFLVSTCSSLVEGSVGVPVPNHSGTDHCQMINAMVRMNREFRGCQAQGCLVMTKHGMEEL